MASANQQSTVFLTPEETDRVQKTFKGRLTKCRELAGQPRVPEDLNTILSQATSASLMADMADDSDFGGQKSQSDTMVTIGIGSPYPPCIAPLKELQSINLTELRMDTHHRGRKLIVRRVGPVVTLVACSWTVVTDESSGESERLELSLHKAHHGQDILESGSVFEIKEPYFTLNHQGDPAILIDHPSDLVVYTDSTNPHTSVKKSAGSKFVHSTGSASEESTKNASKCKEEGNAALKQKDLALAHECYSNGLKLTVTEGEGKEELAYDLFRNRAHVNLSLNRFDEAKSDALAAITGLEDQKYKDLDSKAYFRAGSAAYHLGEFQEAKCFFEEQQKLTPDDKNVPIRLRNTELRLQEQATGAYNFKKITAGLKVSPRVDAASFTNNTKIAESPGRGRGLFATRKIASGEIVLCEKSFCVVWGHEPGAMIAITYDSRDERIRLAPVGLSKAIVQKLRDNPSQVKSVLSLYGDYPGIGKELIIGESSAVVDTFQVHDVVSRNAFGPGPALNQAESTMSANAGLWVLAAYANHSCLSNTTKESIGDMMILRATQAIVEGEEITHSYNESSDYDARTAALMTTWGFTCDCALCKVERADDPTVRKKRHELEAKANAWVENTSPIKAKMTSVVRAKNFMKSINETYDQKRYKDLPRTALKGIKQWLDVANP